MRLPRNGIKGGDPEMYLQDPDIGTVESDLVIGIIR